MNSKIHIDIDDTSKKLIKLNLFLVVTLVVAVVTYYQIIDWLQLSHEIALAYSFLLGFGVSGMAVWVRISRRKRQ